MSDKAILLMIRHGQSVANVERRFTRSDDEPLTALGVQQAVDAGRRLAVFCRPAALYCSRYLRALETAKKIGEAFDLEPIVVDGLHEQSFGRLKGEPYEAWYELMGELPPPEERWFHRAPEGESLEDVKLRAGLVLDDLSRRHVGDQIVVVSHGGVMAALRAHVRGHFNDAPVSTDNAWGYRIHGWIKPPDRVRYEGPLDLEDESRAEPCGGSGPNPVSAG